MMVNTKLIPEDICDQAITGAAVFYRSLERAANSPPKDHAEKSKLVLDLVASSGIVSDCFDEVDEVIAEE